MLVGHFATCDEGDGRGVQHVDAIHSAEVEDLELVLAENTRRSFLIDVVAQRAECVELRVCDVLRRD